MTLFRDIREELKENKETLPVDKVEAKKSLLILFLILLGLGLAVTVIWFITGWLAHQEVKMKKKKKGVIQRRGVISPFIG